MTKYTNKVNGASLYHGNCFEVLPTLADNSVDMVFADIPYNMTSANWDKEQFDLETMWEHLNRVVKPKRAMVFTAVFPFAADLVSSNRGNFKSDWVWKKGRISGSMLAKKKPMRWFENVLVFAHGGMPDYYPIMVKRAPEHMRWGNNQGVKYTGYDEVGADKKVKKRGPRDPYKHPSNIIDARFAGGISGAPEARENGKHPTQKPVSLMTYLIRTYSQEGDTVLDFTMGSGSTGVAAIEVGRKFIGIEMDDQHYATAKNRVGDTIYQREQEIPGITPAHQTELI